jgi:hypothetical protein
VLHPPPTKYWLATPGNILMLLGEEFLCQSSMERRCGQYCSSQSRGETNAWGRWNTYAWTWKTLGLLALLLN